LAIPFDGTASSCLGWARPDLRRLLSPRAHQKATLPFGGGPDPDKQGPPFPFFFPFLSPCRNLLFLGFLEWAYFPPTLPPSSSRLSDTVPVLRFFLFFCGNFFKFRTWRKVSPLSSHLSYRYCSAAESSSYPTFLLQFPLSFFAFCSSSILSEDQADPLPAWPPLGFLSLSPLIPSRSHVGRSNRIHHFLFFLWSV